MRNNSKLNSNIFYTTLCLLGASFAIYIFLMGNVIFSIVARKNIEQDTRDISSHLGALETEYINLSKNIDHDLAMSLGFVDSPKIHFATHKEAVGLLGKSNDL